MNKEIKPDLESRIHSKMKAGCLALAPLASSPLAAGVQHRSLTGVSPDSAPSNHTHQVVCIQPGADSDLQNHRVLSQSCFAQERENGQKGCHSPFGLIKAQLSKPASPFSFLKELCS